jgi:hypothetical protein
MDALTGYRSIPNANPPLEAAADDAEFLREVAGKIAEALTLLDQRQTITFAADRAIDAVYRPLEDAAARLHSAADDVMSDAEDK